MTDFSKLRDELHLWNIDISNEQLHMFEEYFEMLISWNEKINLTAITDIEGVTYKHFLDSLSIMKYVDLSNKSLLDVGTGAGFPGIPLAIMNSDCKISLLDSLNKRINFLNEVCNSIGLTNVTSFHGRSEDYGVKKEFREGFDFVTSRAVANLSTLSEYCIPFVKVGGQFISYKSDQADDEIKAASSAIKILGGKLDSIETYSISYDNIINKLVFINKVKPTGKNYPRKAGTPSKMPL